MSSVDVVKLRETAERAAGVTAPVASQHPVPVAVIVSDLAHGVLALLSDREELVGRLQQMAGAEREGAKESIARAVAYETAAEMAAGGSPL